ncbi:DNA-directed RNA polymerases I, II, and III subunit RPABC3 [Ophidiomyces ophidiicola]|nr:DNA-directed RNA polymerases I, II, and III subunit RPABC3 [Ophidiomyces ophidiicola]
MSDPILFEDTFTIMAVNAQKYDRVSRISCTSTDQLITFTLDVNTELYPCTPGDSLSLALASTLSLDGKEENTGRRAAWRDVGMGETTLANDYDYVCYGKVYRFEDSSTAGNILGRILQWETLQANMIFSQNKDRLRFFRRFVAIFGWTLQKAEPSAN